MRLGQGQKFAQWSIHAQQRPVAVHAASAEHREGPRDALPARFKQQRPAQIAVVFQAVPGADNQRGGRVPGRCDDGGGAALVIVHGVTVFVANGGDQQAP